MAEKIVLASLEIDMSALIKSTSELKAEIDRLKDSQKELTKEGDTASEQYVQNAADLKALNTAYNANVKAIAESTTAQADQANQSKLVALALSTEVQSIKEARDQNALLNRLRNETNVSTTEGKAQLEALNKKLDENNAFIKENADQYLQQKLNIGNYASALEGLSPQMSGFINDLKGTYANLLVAKEALIAQSSALVGTTTATSGASKALNFFKIALVSTGIGAIVVALGALISYLTTTQGGIDKLTAVTRPLQAIFQSLIGVFQNVGKYLFEAFSNPKKTMTELYEFVKQNLINRFTAFGKILEGIINLDFQKVTDGVLQAGTGVENLTDKIQKGAKETGKFLDAAIKKGQEIDRLKKEIERSELAYQRAQIKTNDLIDEQKLIVKDTSRSFAERGAAANEIIRLTTELSKKEEEIIAKKIKALQLEYSMKDAKALTIEEQQKMIDLEKQLDEAQDRGLNAQLENSKVLSGLKKEQEAQAKEAQAKELERQNKAIEAQLTKSKEEIELFKVKESEKAKTAEEQYQFNKQLYDKENADLKLQYDKGKISKLQYETDKLKLSQTFAQQNADTLAQFANAELNLFLEQNKSKLEGAKVLTDELVAEEENRLRLIAQKQTENLAIEKGIDVAKLEQKKKNNEALTISEIEFETERIRIASETDATIQTNKETLDEQIKAKKAEQLAIDKELALAEAETKAEEDAIKAEEQYNLEMERLNKLLTDKKITQDQFDALKASADKKNEEMARIAALNRTQAQLQEFQKVGAGLEGLFGKNKAIASATALINGGLAVTEILKTPSTFPEPYASISRGIQIAGTVATTARSIAQINGAKFEKGGIQEIGGKRHSGGGTKFYGEDGTTFEAERGEGIGILNRSAFSTFMDFNNRFGSGSSSGGFFQGGGIITQGVRSESTNMDAVVDAIASIPAPVVAVEEIQSVGNRFVQVQQNANL